MSVPPTGTTTLQPSALTVLADGMLTGSTAGYEKRLVEMAGAYADAAAFQGAIETRGTDAVVYSVRSHQYDNSPGALIVGTSTLLPGTIGGEFAMTRGHLHRIANRGELYYCVSGHGLVLLDAVGGDSATVELTPGLATSIPGGWVHRSVNIGTEPFVTLFCYAADAGQDYEVISAAGGMSMRIVDDGHGGWKQLPNDDHRGYAMATSRSAAHPSPADGRSCP
jgi:glucose-6-phosphate isomerase